MLTSINVSKTFLSVAGVTERGFFNSDMMLVESEKAMMAAAEQTIILTDHTKFGKISLSQICRLQDVNRVVTDSGLSSQWKPRLESAGVELTLASVDVNVGDAKVDPQVSPTGLHTNTSPTLSNQTFSS